MPVASVRLLTPDGVAHDLFVGDVIGRVWHAALQILDPRISEFHACVSLRSGELVLLPLRGSVRLGGVAVKALRLEEGLQVELAPDFSLGVQALTLPDRLPALTIDGADPVALERTACSVVGGALVPGLRDGASARLWSDGERWYVDDGTGSTAIAPGWQGEIDGTRLAFCELAAEQAGVPATIGRPTSAPLHLVIRYDTVQFQRIGGSITSMSGLPARLVSELAQLGGPAHWEVVAKELWRTQLDRSTLRARWDKTLWTVRRKLDAAGLPPDLVRSVGGYCELVLRPHDSLDVEV